MDTDDIRAERERIAREKEELLMKLEGSSQPARLTPRKGKKEHSGIQFSLRGKKLQEQWHIESDSDDEQKGLDTALDSVLTAVGRTTKNILPGTSSVADIEKYVSAAHKEKVDKLKKQNKGYLKPRSNW